MLCICAIELFIDELLYIHQYTFIYFANSWLYRLPGHTAVRVVFYVFLSGIFGFILHGSGACLVQYSRLGLVSYLHIDIVRKS